MSATERKDGRPKKETQKEPNNNLKETQEEPEQNLNDNVDVDDNVNVNVNVNDNNNNVVVGDSCVDGLQEVIKFYNENIGLITPYGLEVLSDYTKEMPYDVIIYAMKKAVEANVRTIQYIKGTLNNWKNANVKTLIQAQEESQKFKNNKQEIAKEETEEEKQLRKIKELEAMQDGS